MRSLKCFLVSHSLVGLLAACSSGGLMDGEPDINCPGGVIQSLPRYKNVICFKTAPLPPQI